MKSITLKEYFDLKGYGIGKRINVSMFANLTNTSVSFISKLLNNQYISAKKGKAFKRVEELLKKDGYQLITGNVIELGMNNILKENDRLKLENNSLKLENQRLNEIINNYNDLEKLVNKIYKLKENK